MSEAHRSSGKRTREQAWTNIDMHVKLGKALFLHKGLCSFQKTASKHLNVLWILINVWRGTFPRFYVF